MVPVAEVVELLDAAGNIGRRQDARMASQAQRRVVEAETERHLIQTETHQ